MSNELALQAKEIWDQKVKPQLALGRLEELAINIVTIRGELYPKLTKPKVICICCRLTDLCTKCLFKSAGDYLSTS